MRRPGFSRSPFSSLDHNGEHFRTWESPVTPGQPAFTCIQTDNDHESETSEARNQASRNRAHPSEQIVVGHHGTQIEAVEACREMTSRSRRHGLHSTQRTFVVYIVLLKLKRRRNRNIRAIAHHSQICNDATNSSEQRRNRQHTRENRITTKDNNQQNRPLSAYQGIRSARKTRLLIAAAAQTSET